MQAAKKEDTPPSALVFSDSRENATRGLSDDSRGDGGGGGIDLSLSRRFARASSVARCNDASSSTDPPPKKLEKLPKWAEWDAPIEFASPSCSSGKDTFGASTSRSSEKLDIYEHNLLVSLVVGSVKLIYKCDGDSNWLGSSGGCFNRKWKPDCYSRFSPP